MSEILGTVKLTGAISPYDTTDIYAVFDDIYGRGGYRVVSDDTERDAITDDRRKIGMMVYVTGTSIAYVLTGSTNSDWEEFAPSGGGGGQTIATEDEGVSVDTIATTINFVGDGVTATDAGSNVTTITIPGGSTTSLMPREISGGTGSQADSTFGAGWSGYHWIPGNLVVQGDDFVCGPNDNSGIHFQHGNSYILYTEDTTPNAYKLLGASNATTDIRLWGDYYAGNGKYFCSNPSYNGSNNVVGSGIWFGQSTTSENITYQTGIVSASTAITSNGMLRSNTGILRLHEDGVGSPYDDSVGIWFTDNNTGASITYGIGGSINVTLENESAEFRVLTGQTRLNQDLIVGDVLFLNANNYLESNGGGKINFNDGASSYASIGYSTGNSRFEVSHRMETSTLSASTFISKGNSTIEGLLNVEDSITFIDDHGGSGYPTLKYDTASDRFEFGSNGPYDYGLDVYMESGLTVNGDLTAGTMRSNGDIYINYDGVDGDSFLYFYNSSNPENVYLKWVESSGKLLTNVEFATDNTLISVDDNNSGYGGIKFCNGIGVLSYSSSESKFIISDNTLINGNLTVDTGNLVIADDTLTGHTFISTGANLWTTQFPVKTSTSPFDVLLIEDTYNSGNKKYILANSLPYASESYADNAGLQNHDLISQWAELADPGIPAGVGTGYTLQLKLDNSGTVVASTDTIYTVQMDVPTTSTETGAKYIVYYNLASSGDTLDGFPNPSGWTCYPVSLAGENTNHPLLFFSGEDSTLHAYNNNSSEYVLNYNINQINVGNNKTISPHIMGSDYMWQRNMDDLFYDGNIEISGSVMADEYSGITMTKGITVPDPTDSENITLFKTNRNVTFISTETVVNGSSPSVNWTLKYHTDRTNSGTVIKSSTADNVTVGSGDTFSVSVASDNWIWLETSSTSGTINELHLTLEYKED